MSDYKHPFNLSLAKKTSVMDDKSVCTKHIHDKKKIIRYEHVSTLTH